MINDFNERENYGGFGYEAPTSAPLTDREEVNNLSYSLEEIVIEPELE